MADLANHSTCLGQAASDFLSQAQTGQVLACVHHATYLQTQAGELFWLAVTGSPMHRRCIRMHAPLPGPAVGSTFTTGDRWIKLEGGTLLDFAALPVWQVPPIPPGRVIPLDGLSGQLFSVLEILLSGAAPPGFGLMIRPVLQVAHNENAAPVFPPGDIFNQPAWPRVQQIARACLQQDLLRVLEPAGHLVGLGEGLTPAGDDFLGGLFFARHLLVSAYPSLAALETPNLDEWIEANRTRTNLISFTLLQDNFAGHALEPLHRFGMALFSGQPLEEAVAAAEDLTGVGHSTGWSLLAGFAAGLLLANAWNADPCTARKGRCQRGRTWIKGTMKG